MAASTIEKTVYFVRHGRSEANVSPVFQAPHSPLDETGKHQAQRVATRVARLSFDTLLSSPFSRAKETAEAIAKATGKEPEYSDLFVERLKPTSIDGKLFSDPEAAALWRAWNESLYVSGARVLDGENFDDLLVRADRALAFLTARPEQSLVVVTHGYFLRTLVARVLLGDALSGDTFQRVQRMASTENTGLTVLRYQGAFEEEPWWRLWTYNDHAHLQ